MGGSQVHSGMSAAARRVRRRESAAKFGGKTLSALMAVILAVGLMPLPAFGDEGVVINGQKVVAASSQTLTTVDEDGNVSTETTETTVSEDGTVTTNGMEELDATASAYGAALIDAASSGKETIGTLYDHEDANTGLDLDEGIEAQKAAAEDVDDDVTTVAIIDTAVAEDADVINISFAGYNVSGNEAIAEGVNLFADSDATLVAAAGNLNQDVAMTRTR